MENLLLELKKEKFLNVDFNYFKFVHLLVLKELIVQDCKNTLNFSVHS